MGLYVATGTLASSLSVSVILLLVDRLGTQSAFIGVLVAACLSLAAALVLLGLQLGGDRDKPEPVAVEQQNTPASSGA
jgi:hypothetical protein